MLRRPLRFLFACLLILPLSVVFAGEWSPDEVRAILAERIDEHEQSVGIAVGLVDENGSTVVGYGRLSEDDVRVLDGKTVFEIGSISKVFTSILLADMVRRGKVDLDDPVQEYLPQSVTVPTWDNTAITLYDLSTHTSGLPRMPDNFAPADPSNPYADYTVEQMYEFLSGAELAGKPGENAEYSNLGTGLLGHVLALKAGTDYETLVRKRIIDPLKMADTVITLTPKLEERMAQGHDATLEPTSNWDIPTLAGAGALRSTVDDMLLFLAANLGLKKSPVYKAMKDTHAAREEFGMPDMQIGLGWLIREGHGHTIHWHNGETGGFRSFAGFDADANRGVVVLSNSSNDIGDIGFHLLVPAFELSKFRTVDEAVEFDPEKFDDYVGRYQLSPDFIFIVTRDGDRYWVLTTGRGIIEVFPESETRFFATAVEGAISFHRDEDGKVSHMMLRQGGMDQRADWLDADVPETPATVDVAEEVLQRYVGRYELQPGNIINVRREGGTLFAQLTSQPEFEIFAESETKFFWRVADAQITFNAGEGGRIDSATLHQGGRNMPAPRLGAIPTDQYEKRSIEGWTVYVNKDLLADGDLGIETLRMLQERLEKIAQDVPERACDALRRVPIWLGAEGRGSSYHPSREWLQTNGYNPDKARSIEIGNVAELASTSDDQSWMVLRLLAFAYYDQVLGHDHEGIQTAYQAALDRGDHERNALLYFAHGTVAFFSTDDDVRDELRRRDPKLFELLEEVW